MASALVRFQLIDENAGRRMGALSSIERDPDESHLEVLRTVDDVETHLVMSPHAKQNIEIETVYDARAVEQLAEIKLR